MGWPDSYTKKAHKEGYAARSVYKLQELDEKLKLLKSGMRVLDLGCFPGSFSQYAAKKVGSDGFVLGIDQKKTKHIASNVKTMMGDVMDEKTLAKIESYGPFDIIFSDMAPQTTGTRKLDQDRSALLVERAWEIAQAVGKPGALAVIKYFQGAETTKFLRQHKVKTYKPTASRAASYEMFAIIGIST